MSRASEGAVVRAAPASWVIAVVVAFCAVLLLKWLALVAVAAVVLFVVARWARGGWDAGAAAVPATATARSAPAAAPGDDQQAGPAWPSRLPYTVDDAEVPEPRSSAHDDCSWCGLRGGHRDDRGRLVRPRHAHAS